MLKEVGQAYLGSIHTIKSKDKRVESGRIVSEAGQTDSPTNHDSSTGVQKREVKRSNPSINYGEAVYFRREETHMHQLYQNTRQSVEASREQKVNNLRTMIRENRYTPNLLVVAERLLSSGAISRN